MNRAAMIRVLLVSMLLGACAGWALALAMGGAP